MEPKRTKMESDVELEFCVIEIRYADGDWFEAVEEGSATKRMELVAQSLREVGLSGLFINFGEPQQLASEAYKSKYELQGFRAYPTSICFEPGSEMVSIAIAAATLVVSTGNLQVAQEQLDIAKNHLPAIHAVAKNYCERLVRSIKATFEAEIQRERAPDGSSSSFSFRVSGEVRTIRNRTSGDRWARQHETNRSRR